MHGFWRLPPVEDWAWLGKNDSSLRVQADAVHGGCTDQSFTTSSAPGTHGLWSKSQQWSATVEVRRSAQDALRGGRAGQH